MFTKSMNKLQATSPPRDTRSASIKATSANELPGKPKLISNFPSPGLLLKGFCVSRSRELLGWMSDVVMAST
jgi:hypothetical protein